MELNKQQQTTINDLMRKLKNLDPQIPTNTNSFQSQVKVMCIYQDTRLCVVQSKKTGCMQTE